MVGHRPHENPGPGVFKKQYENRQEEKRDPDAPEVQVGQLYPPQVNGLLGKNIELADIVSPDHNHNTSEHIGETQGHHDNGDDRFADKRAQDEAFHNKAKDD